MQKPKQLLKRLSQGWDELKMAARTIAIGDIHGYSTALRALLAIISPTSEDTVIQLGDAIDRGTDSQGVLELLIRVAEQSNLIFVKGNHEELLLNALDDAAALPRWLRNGGNSTLESYGCADPTEISEKHLKFVRSAIDYYETERFVFLHAGYVENLELNEQPALALRWRVTNKNTPPHLSGKTVVTGHTPQLSGKVLDLGHVICIDTNCVHGGWLSAIDMESRTVWQANNRGEAYVYLKGQQC